MSGALLSVEALDAGYGGARVLHGISIRVDPGEMVFVTGRNGSGKTTLLRTIAGFLPPAGGAVRLSGDDLLGLPPEEVARRGVRYVLQDKKVFSKLTARENIELAAYSSGERADDAVERIVALHPPMERLLDGRAEALSGGQRQILLIGRALAGRPKLLLVDEPTEGLAAGVIEDLFRLFAGMKGRLSLLVVEQNLPLAARLADRVYVMKEGAIARELSTRAGIEEPGALEGDP